MTWKSCSWQFEALIIGSWGSTWITDLGVCLLLGVERDDEFWLRITVKHVQVIEKTAPNIFWNIVVIKNLEENLSNSISVYSKENEVYCMYVFPVLVRVKSGSVKAYWYGVFEVFAQGFYPFLKSVAVVFVAEGKAVFPEVFKNERLHICHQATIVVARNENQSRSRAICSRISRQTVLTVFHHRCEISCEGRGMARFELSTDSFGVLEFLLWGPSFLRC